MRFNGEAYSKLFPHNDKPENVESIVEINDDTDVIETEENDDNESDDLVD